jgi:hypothetical protein
VHLQTVFFCVATVFKCGAVEKYCVITGEVCGIWLCGQTKIDVQGLTLNKRLEERALNKEH